MNKSSHANSPQASSLSSLVQPAEFMLAHCNQPSQVSPNSSLALTILASPTRPSRPAQTSKVNWAQPSQFIPSHPIPSRKGEVTGEDGAEAPLHCWQGWDGPSLCTISRVVPPNTKYRATIAPSCLVLEYIYPKEQKSVYSGDIFLYLLQDSS